MKDKVISLFSVAKYLVFNPLLKQNSYDDGISGKKVLIEPLYKLAIKHPNLNLATVVRLLIRWENLR